MAKSSKPEVWLRGSLDHMPALVQPVAHAILQAREEINESMIGFPDDRLWDKVAGVASVGFHLQHLTGVLDRLFTYAGGRQLNNKQLNYLASEGKTANMSVSELLDKLNKQIDTSLIKISNIDEQTLTHKRGVGRVQLPSTVIGLLVHAAEHTMRHTGQLLVAVRILKF